MRCGGGNRIVQDALDRRTPETRASCIHSAGTNPAKVRRQLLLNPYAYGDSSAPRAGSPGQRGVLDARRGQI
jgi:hypothetical protein